MARTEPVQRQDPGASTGTRTQGHEPFTAFVVHMQGTESEVECFVLE